jgi:hypothetical protein
MRMRAAQARTIAGNFREPLFTRWAMGASSRS